LRGGLRKKGIKGIMKKFWLLLLMVTPLQLVHSQEVHHAPHGRTMPCRSEIIAVEVRREP
jgi:hypothetical protein